MNEDNFLYTFLKKKGLEKDLWETIQEENVRRLEELKQRTLLINYGEKPEKRLPVFLVTPKSNYALSEPKLAKRRLVFSHLSSFGLTATAVLALLALPYLSRLILQNPKDSEQRYEVRYIDAGSLHPLPTSPPIGYNPNTKLGETTQSASSSKEIGDVTNEFIAPKAISKESLGSELEKMILAGKSPEEIYNYTTKKGSRNETTYVDFVKSYVDAYLRIHDDQSKIFSELSSNRDLGHIVALHIDIDHDGRTFAYTHRPAYLPDDIWGDSLKDPNDAIWNHYHNLVKSIPKKFVMPSEGGIYCKIISIELYVRNGLLNSALDPSNFSRTDLRYSSIDDVMFLLKGGQVVRIGKDNLLYFKENGKITQVGTYNNGKVNWLSGFR